MYLTFAKILQQALLTTRANFCNWHMFEWTKVNGCQPFTLIIHAWQKLPAPGYVTKHYLSGENKFPRLSR
jgi:hypothetical protein